MVQLLPLWNDGFLYSHVRVACHSFEEGQCSDNLQPPLGLLLRLLVEDLVNGLPLQECQVAPLGLDANRLLGHEVSDVVVAGVAEGVQTHQGVLLLAIVWDRVLIERHLEVGVAFDVGCRAKFSPAGPPEICDGIDVHCFLLFQEGRSSSYWRNRCLDFSDVL